MQHAQKYKAEHMRELGQKSFETLKNQHNIYIACL